MELAYVAETVVNASFRPFNDSTRCCTFDVCSERETADAE